MERTTIELPEEIMERARTYGELRALSLDEVLERGILSLLGDSPTDTDPTAAAAEREWALPVIHGVEVLCAIEDLKDIAFQDYDEHVVEKITGQS